MKEIVVYTLPGCQHCSGLLKMLKQEEIQAIVLDALAPENMQASNSLDEYFESARYPKVLVLSREHTTYILPVEDKRIVDTRASSFLYYNTVPEIVNYIKRIL